MILPIETTPKDFFNLYVSILNPILKLRHREADILEAFLRVHYANRYHSNVNQLLFSSSVLKSIRESLNMTVASFNNHKHRLRKKEIFIGRTINPLITKNYPTNGKLNITFAMSITSTKNGANNTNTENTNLWGKNNSSSVQQGLQSSKQVSKA